MEAKERDDAEHLRDLRQAAGLNIAQLAAMANLSAGQIRQLEDGGDNLFYSPQIKSQSLRRVIRMLENPAPVGAPLKAMAEEPAPRSPANVIDDIIRLSEKNLSGNVVTSVVRRPARLGGVLSVFVLLAFGLLAIAGWQSSQDIPVSKFSEWVNPIGVSVPTEQTPTADSREPVANQAVKTEQVETQAVATASEPASLATAPATLNAAATADNQPRLDPVKPHTENAALAEPTKLETSALSVDKNDCAAINTDPTSVSPHSVSKPGNYVYLQATKPVQLCVDDAKRNRTVLNLAPGSGRSVHGPAPWTISSNALSSVNIYYQGSKLMLPANVGQRIYLAEQVVSP